MNGIKLTNGQSEALAMVNHLLASEDAAFATLTGYAGTGKTTLLRVLADVHGAPLVLTPTGKAALRVTEATGLPASTVHRYLYKPSEDPKTGEPRFARKPTDDLFVPTSGLVVVDEASMLSEEVWLDLWGTCSSLGLRVLLVGDPFQLPPVVKRTEAGWTTFSALTDLRTPHRAHLAEVMRQALESPVLRAATAIRQGEMEAMDAVAELPSVAPERLVERFLGLPGTRALIAHTNETRQRLNLGVRAALGHGDALVPGEPLLVLQNNYPLDRYNGEVVGFGGWAQDPDEPLPVRDRYKNVSVMMSFGLARVDEGVAILSPDEVFGRTGGASMSALRRAGVDHAVHEWGFERRAAPSHLNANLGYALTCSKSQGSEWDDICVCVEPTVAQVNGGKFSHGWRRFMYTAISRARHSATLCFLENQ